MAQAPQCDLDRIMGVMQAAFEPLYGEAWTRRQVADALLLPSTCYALLDAEGQVPAEGTQAAGFTLSRHFLDEEELLLIAVSPAARRRGVGRLLLDALVISAKERGISRIFLEMREGNPAESLYRSVGFEPVGRRPGYYRIADGRRLDAITFALTI
jgi:ribosomal-protein-alanine N-acetyltransferase